MHLTLQCRKVSLLTWTECELSEKKNQINYYSVVKKWRGG